MRLDNSWGRNGWAQAREQAFQSPGYSLCYALDRLTTFGAELFPERGGQDLELSQADMGNKQAHVEEVAFGGDYKFGLHETGYSDFDRCGIRLRA